MLEIMGAKPQLLVEPLESVIDINPLKRRDLELKIATDSTYYYHECRISSLSWPASDQESTDGTMGYLVHS